MLPRPARLLLRVHLLALTAALLTGCFLQNMFGRVIIVEDIAEEVNQIIANVFGNGTAAVCLATDYGYHECTYIIDGEIITSTLYLLSEYGLYGVLYDPLVLQVPSDAISITALYTPTPGGVAQPAPMLVTTQFPVRHGTVVTAQPGTKFLIIEFQPGISGTLPMTYPTNGKPFDYSLEIARRQPITQTVEPIQLKAMLTGKVVSRGYTYYAPVLPCTTSFASVPTLTIPITSTFVNLLSQLGDAIRGGHVQTCDHALYDYSNTPEPLDKFIYLPGIAR